MHLGCECHLCTLGVRLVVLPHFLQTCHCKDSQVFSVVPFHGGLRKLGTLEGNIMKCDMAGSLVMEPLDKSLEGTLWHDGHHDALCCSLSGTGHGERQPWAVCLLQIYRINGWICCFYYHGRNSCSVSFQEAAVYNPPTVCSWCFFGVNTVWSRSCIKLR